MPRTPAQSQADADAQTLRLADQARTQAAANDRAAQAQTTSELLAHLVRTAGA
jgi:hypothetical protein